MLDATIFTCQEPTYKPWTYRRFRDLVTLIIEEANRRQFTDFHVAILFLGTSSMRIADLPTYSGRTEEVHEKARYHSYSQWFPEHPEVFDKRYDVFYFGAPIKLPADEQICKQNDPTFGEYFADKLCDFGTQTGVSAVVFRDNIFSPAYIRGYTHGRYMKSKYRHDFNTAIIKMLARIKQTCPEFITIGYSSGVSSIEEWRSNGFDLETVARSGYLDLWITQTWASAWQDYWPCHSQGYTFQLANVLANLAMLADTPCKSLFLIETFDAWEPWDSIYQYPSKVTWEIWAYSHAAAILPNNQLYRTAGFYSSWMNRREDLLSEETVQLLHSVLDACSNDLDHSPVPGGPCVVYHREGFEHLFDDPTPYCRGEAWDDWCGMLLKYGIPILSVTRSEWLPATQADGYILPSGADLSQTCQNFIHQELQQQKPTLLMGLASILPKMFRQNLSIEIEPLLIESLLPSSGHIEDELAVQMGIRGLVLNQRRRSLHTNDAWIPLIQCLNGPVFAVNKSLPIWVWETPEWGTPFELDLNLDSIQSPQTYRVVAETFNQSGWGSDQVRWQNNEWQKPSTFLFWRYPDGKMGVLLGNLERGICGNSQFSVRGALSIEEMVARQVLPLEPYAPGEAYIENGRLQVGLGPHKFGILVIS